MQVKEWLQAREIKRDEFAERIGCIPETLSAICSGKRRASGARCSRIIKESNGEITFEEIMAPYWERAARLREERKARRISIKRLAETAGVNPKHLEGMNGDDWDPPPGVLSAVEKVLTEKAAA